MIAVFESSHVVGSFVESLSEKKQTGLLYCLLRKNAKVGRNNTYAWELPKAAVAVKKWKDDDKYGCVYLS